MIIPTAALFRVELALLDEAEAKEHYVAWYYHRTLTVVASDAEAAVILARQHFDDVPPERVRIHSVEFVEQISISSAVIRLKA